MKTVNSSWIFSSEKVDRSTLSDELAEFCAKYPIIQLDPVKDSTSVEEDNGKGQNSLFVIRYSLFVIRYSLFVIRYSLFVTVSVPLICKVSSGTRALDMCAGGRESVALGSNHEGKITEKLKCKIIIDRV